jgi:hypothetical protein
VWPDGRTELLFHYGDRYRLHGADGALLGHGLLIGPLTRRLVLSSAGSTRVVGVRFHPWGLAGLLRMPVDELTDTVVPVEALWGGEGRRLVERLAEAGDEEAARAVEGFLLGRVRPAPVELRAVAATAGAIVGRPQVASGPHPPGRSRRQLQRRFKRAIGLSAKRLAVIGRFDAVRRHLLAHPHDDLSDVACRFGYFDYAHLSRDFGRFLGVTPHAFRASVACARAGDPGDVVFLHDPPPPSPSAWGP